MEEHIRKSIFFCEFQRQCTRKFIYFSSVIHHQFGDFFFLWYKWNQNISFPYVFSHCVGLLAAWVIWLKLLKISDLINSKRTDLLYLWGWVSHVFQTVAQSYEMWSKWVTDWGEVGGADTHSVSQDNTCLSLFIFYLNLSKSVSRPERCGRIHGDVEIFFHEKIGSELIL